jgi:hypothetical protein
MSYPIDPKPRIMNFSSLRQRLQCSVLYGLFVLTLIGGFITSIDKAGGLFAEAEILAKNTFDTEYVLGEKKNGFNLLLDEYDQSRSVESVAREARIYRQQLTLKSYQANIAEASASFLMALFLLSTVVYVDETAWERRYTGYFIIFQAMCWSVGLAALSSAFETEIQRWLATSLAGYSQGTLLLAGLVAAVIAGACYIDFFRGKPATQETDQC